MSAHGNDFLAESIAEFRRLKTRAEKALAQVDDAQFFHAIDPETNSLAVNVKHMAGNLRSRWTNFLTSDGEKPDRNRDSEFLIEEGDTRAALMERWEANWAVLFAALEPLTPADLERTVLIRLEPHTVVQAIVRQLTHYSYHVGQMVQLAKHQRGAAWTTLSVPRGQSEEFNRMMAEKFKTSGR